jgi:hypothetical protein
VRAAAGMLIDLHPCPLIRDNPMSDRCTPTKSGSTTVPFERVLLDAVDDALLIFGEAVRAAIYDCIEERYQIRREEIPDRLEAFHRALEELLGKNWETVKRLIVENLYSRLDLEFTEQEGWTLADYLYCARTNTQF